MVESSFQDHRSKAREFALGVLYDLDALALDDRAGALATLLAEPPRGDEPDEAVFVELTLEPRVRAFGTKLLTVVESRLIEIDGLIQTCSKRWRIDRMAQIDRNVIRLATAELLEGQTPKGVVLSEAVQLAARYGSEHSVAFVNAIVEAVAERIGEIRRKAAEDV